VGSYRNGISGFTYGGAKYINIMENSIFRFRIIWANTSRFPLKGILDAEIKHTIKVKTGKLTFVYCTSHMEMHSAFYSAVSSLETVSSVRFPPLRSHVSHAWFDEQ